MTHQTQTMGKITSVLRVVMLVGVVCIIFLAANFALTVTAVVSNKDVYVNSGKGLVDSSGHELSVRVSSSKMTIYDFPYQGLDNIVKSDAIVVKSGGDKLVLYPGSFEFRAAEYGYELHMTAVDGTTVTWGPPSRFGVDGQLLEPLRATGGRFINIKRPNGEVHVNKQGEGRRLPGLPDGVAYGPSTAKGIQHMTAHCSATINNGDSHYAKVRGWSASSKTTASIGVYLPATTLAVENAVDTPLCQALAGKGMNCFIVEYENLEYFHDDDGFVERATSIGTCIDEICGTAGAGDCAKGLGVWGFSQGGQFAFVVGDYVTWTNNPVTAALSFSGSVHYSQTGWYATHPFAVWNHNTRDDQWASMSPHMAKTARERRRLIMGAHDDVMGGTSVFLSVGQGSTAHVVWGAQHVTGLEDTDCDSTKGFAEGGHGALSCLQGADKNQWGYLLVKASDWGGTFAGHEWFCTHERDDPATGGVTGLQSAFSNPKATGEWALHPNLDWFKTTAENNGH